jgi:hypothetical protein
MAPLPADVEEGRGGIPLEKPPPNMTEIGPEFQGFTSRFQESGRRIGLFFGMTGLSGC